MSDKANARAEPDEQRLEAPREGWELAAVIVFVIALACAFSLVRETRTSAPMSATAVARAGRLKRSR